MGKWNKIFLYISFIGIVFVIFKTDNISIPHFDDKGSLILALICILFIYFLEGWRWKSILGSYGQDINLRDGLISHGINIFGTYVPGKIWYILGKASFISNRYTIDAKDVLYASTMSQILALWTGTLVGILSLTCGKIEQYLLWAVVILFFACSVVLFWKPSNNLLNHIVVKFFKFESGIPPFNFRKSLPTIIIFFLYWVTISLGFYFLVISLGFNIPLAAGAIFPLSIVIGIISLIAPSGLGVREGFLAAYLFMYGFDFAEASLIALVSRLWYLSGEVFSFIVAFALNQFRLT